MEYLYKWSWFIKERFNPLLYTGMGVIFLGAHYSLYLNFIDKEVFLSLSTVFYLMPIALATLLFFFKLRLLDEVKDRESDILHHPERPLPRKLLSEGEVTQSAFIIMVVEIFLFSLYGFPAFLGALVVVGYSLVMYKEFFIKDWLRSHLTTYAVTHTFVVVFLSLAIFVALFGGSFRGIPKEIFYFCFASWFVFNIFEFGRKTFATSEEQVGVDSYSKIFGKFGAVLLVLAMAGLGNLLIGESTSLFVIKTLFMGSILLVIFGLLYVTSDNLNSAKIYRILTSVYIIFVYGVVIFFQ